MAGSPSERWGSQVEYLLSCLGYAVGIGNLWRFPYLCYRNGGGAFLIPYFLTLLICGIPLVYLESVLGQFASAGCISVFNINPLFKGAGYAVIVLNVIAVIYFASILAYPVLYIYHSLGSPLPWKHCKNVWNTDKCLEITNNSSFSSNISLTTPEDEFFQFLHMSPSINDIGAVVWPVFWCNAICWVLIYFCICNGVKSVGKIVYFTVIFPYVVLSVLFIRGVTLPGAWQGIYFYIVPDWKQLLNPKFVTIEAVIAGLLDEFPRLRKRKKIVTFVACVILFSLSIICNTEAYYWYACDGNVSIQKTYYMETTLHIISLLDAHVAIASVPIVCLLEIVAATYTYGQERFKADVLFMTGKPLKRTWLVLWRYIVPALLAVITVFSLREAAGLAGWSVAMASAIFIPIHAAKVLYQTEGTFKEKLSKSCCPSEEWGPQDPAIRERWIASNMLLNKQENIPFTNISNTT